MKILIDTNVILDFILKRSHYHKSAENLFQLVADDQLEAVIAAHTITNSFYILRKHIDLETRKELLSSIMQLFEVVQIDQNNLINALNNGKIEDLEDALQHECAKQSECSYIITRNKKDFVGSSIKALDTTEFIEMYNCSL